MRFLLNGSSGKMGKNILLLAKDYGAECVKGFTSNDDLETEDLADVMIDFSHAEGFDRVLDFCERHKVPLVSGTTGISEEQKRRITKLSATIPVLWASNTSIGVQVLRSMLVKTQAVQNWDVHIVEAHHIHKKDSPSGTAKTLAEDIKKSMNKEEVDISAIRGGGIYGQHQIHLMSEEEVIVLEHTALSRSLFAKGAIEAASFLAKQTPGLYEMKDVIDAK